MQADVERVKVDEFIHLDKRNRTNFDLVFFDFKWNSREKVLHILGKEEAKLKLSKPNILLSCVHSPHNVKKYFNFCIELIKTRNVISIKLFKNYGDLAIEAFNPFKEDLIKNNFYQLNSFSYYWKSYISYDITKSIIFNYNKINQITILGGDQELVNSVKLLKTFAFSEKQRKVKFTTKLQYKPSLSLLSLIKALFSVDISLRKRFSEVFDELAVEINQETRLHPALFSFKFDFKIMSVDTDIILIKQICSFLARDKKFDQILTVFNSKTPCSLFDANFMLKYFRQSSWATYNYVILNYSSYKAIKFNVDLRQNVSQFLTTLLVELREFSNKVRFRYMGNGRILRAGISLARNGIRIADIINVIPY